MKSMRSDIMGLFLKFINNTRKPSGILGKIMIYSMNKGHAKMADWGIKHFPKIQFQNLLDIGCGGGRNALTLLKKYDCAHLTAVDYSPLCVEKTRQYNQQFIKEKRCDVLEANVQTLPFSSDSFEMVTAFETIYFWPGLEDCFKEVYRVLSHEGYFCIVSESDGEDAESQKYEKIIDGMHNYTLIQIKETLKKVGFKTIDCFHHEVKPWIAVIARK